MACSRVKFTFTFSFIIVISIDIFNDGQISTSYCFLPYLFPDLWYYIQYILQYMVAVLTHMNTFQKIKLCICNHLTANVLSAYLT